MIYLNRVLSLSLIKDSVDNASLCDPAKYFLASRIETIGVLKGLLQKLELGNQQS